MLQGTIEQTSVDSYIEEGRSLIQTGNTQGALECFMKAAEADPTNSQVWNDLGVALFVSNQYEPAIEAFETSLRHEPGFADAAINLATAGAKVGNPELGRNAVERALQNDPNNVELQDTLRTLGSESVSAVQAAVTEPAVPTSAEGAAESGPMTVEANPIDACIAQGRQLLQAGETSQASQVFLKAIELDPTNATAWNDLGVALYTGGEMTAAMEAFSTALRHDDQFVDPALNMVPVGKALNCEEQVLQVLNAFLAIDPLNEEVRQAMNGLLGGENVTAEAQRQTRAMELMATGRDHLGRQEYAEAGKVFLQATEEAPGFAPPWNDLGVALYLEEHSELAYQAFQTALQMSPAFADAALNFSKAGERLGRTEEPIEALKRVLAEKPSEADVAKRLGELTGEVTPEAAPAPTSQPIVPQAAAVPSQAPVVQESVEPDVAMDWVEEQILAGRASLANGDPIGAAKTFLGAIEREPTCAMAWNDLGVALYSTGNYAPAVEAFETALSHEPTLVDATINIANAMDNAGQRDAALNVLRTAMIRCPNDKDIRERYDTLSRLPVHEAPVDQPVVHGSKVDEIIARYVRGGSLLAVSSDVEDASGRVEAAYQAGARTAVVQPPVPVRKGGIANIGKMGSFDVVYCGSVLESVPNPLQTLQAIKDSNCQTIVVTTRCVSEHMETNTGTLQITGGSGVFVPACSEGVRAILQEWASQQAGDFRLVDVDTIAEGAWLVDGRQAITPNMWWMWPVSYVKTLLEVAGLQVVEAQADVDAKGCVTFVCRSSN